MAISYSGSDQCGDAAGARWAVAAGCADCGGGTIFGGGGIERGTDLWSL